MDEALVEKVARALCVAHGRDPDEDWRRSGAIMLDIALDDPSRWTLYVRAAQLAIGALPAP